MKPVHEVALPPREIGEKARLDSRDSNQHEHAHDHKSLMRLIHQGRKSGRDGRIANGKVAGGQQRKRGNDDANAQDLEHRTDQHEDQQCAGSPALCGRQEPQELLGRSHGVSAIPVL